MRAARLHLLAATIFVVLATAWSFPLVTHLSTHLPGAGVGDNALFVWNFWWMRTALADGRDFFRSAYLFAPVGVDLTLHTHTALLALVGATLLAHLSAVAALNVTTIAALALNGFCAYMLGWRTTRHWGGAMVGGFIFATSPYLAAHLNGHFNLTSAWTLPLFALSVIPAIAGSQRWAVAAGLVLAATAYVDYYYVVYACVLGLCLVVLSAYDWSMTVRPGRARSTWVWRIAAGVAMVDIVVITVVLLTGGFSARWGAVAVSVKEIYNPVQILWICAAVMAWRFVGPQVTARPRAGWSWTRSAPALLIVGCVFALVASPLIWKGVGLVLRGQYVTQRYYWRSAPSGVDAATLLFGNPFHVFWGAAVRRLYALANGIDVIEGGAWLGIAPLLLCIVAIRRRWDALVVRQWSIVAAVFFLWALGPHLRVFGRDTALILPEAFLRYVPFVANARVPGRALVVVFLALAMLGAVGTATWSVARRRPWLVPAVMAFVVLADAWVSPFPMAAAECPGIYDVLLHRTESGAVAELPLSFGDGLNGELTPVDHRILVCQAVHGRPLVGGVLARLSPDVLKAYELDPLLNSWLRLSGAHLGTVQELAQPSAMLAAQRLESDGIRFIMLNRETASSALRTYVEETMPLTVVAQEGSRVLYIVNR